jgi:predicted alpha-1,6-mannanase (GH76 family)
MENSPPGVLDSETAPAPSLVGVHIAAANMTCIGGYLMQKRGTELFVREKIARAPPEEQRLHMARALHVAAAQNDPKKYAPVLGTLTDPSTTGDDDFFSEVFARNWADCGVWRKRGADAGDQDCSRVYKLQKHQGRY